MQLIPEDEASRGDGLLEEFAVYFQRMYVGQQHLRERFDRASWNMYERIKNNLPRTNNSLEGFHSAFSKTIQDHPPITVLSSKYRKVQHKKGNVREQHLDGRSKPTIRKKYEKVNKSLLDQVSRFDRNQIENLVYLEQIAKSTTINTN